MKARPILFNADMVRAILDGRKTQTRRMVKPLDDNHPIVNLSEFDDRLSGRLNDPDSWGYAYAEDGNHMPLSYWLNLCPHGQPGDLLYVRETCEEDVIGSSSVATYKADDTYLKGVSGCYIDWWYSRQCCPSIYMPRWASRLTLEITDIRVERVQDITDESAIKEGALGMSDPSVKVDWSKGFAIACFAKLWDSINNNWQENPWVWVVEFKVIKMNIDEYLKNNEG